MESIQLVHHDFKEPTPEAASLKQALKDRGIKVLVEVNDKYKFIDLGVPDARLNIEVDGIQHLTNPDQISHDTYSKHNDSSTSGRDS